jgi:hypothetical protein
MCVLEHTSVAWLKSLPKRGGAQEGQALAQVGSAHRLEHCEFPCRQWQIAGARSVLIADDGARPFTSLPLTARDRPGRGTARLASPTATPPPTTARSGCRPRTPDIRSPWPNPTWTPWSPDTRRAYWDIDIEVEVGIDNIRDPNRQPRIDPHGGR